MKKTKLFFTTDVHGSERCFIKFVNSARFYKCDVIVLGGDLTGKMILPILRRPDGSYEAEYLRRKYILKSEEEIQTLEKEAKSIGYYTLVATPEEIEDYTNKMDDVFEKLMVESIRKWVEIAEKRLKGTGVKCFILPGNDDSFSIDPILERSDYVINPEGKVVWIDEKHEMISTGYTNITPWKCPRDISEEELNKKIEGMASKVVDMKNCIFNFHCPPYATVLDEAPELDETLKPVVKGASVQMANVGSTAVLQAIKRYQPLAGLHGHIHESSGFLKIGRTLCLNPGSEYSEGILRGVLIHLDEKGIKDYTRVEG